MSTAARDLMTRALVSVGADTPLLEVYRLFVTEQTHGAPVLDEEERLVGVITSSDLLRAIEDERDTALGSSEYLRDLLEFSGPDWGRGLTDFQDRLAQLTVGDVMDDHGDGRRRDADRRGGRPAAPARHPPRVGRGERVCAWSGCSNVCTMTKELGTPDNGDRGGGYVGRAITICGIRTDGI